MIWLKELREARKINQKELGEIFGVAQNTISNWENGTREPDNETIIKLAEYFNVSTDFLLYGFNKTLFTQCVNYIRNNRSYEQFAVDTGLDAKYAAKICTGIINEKPPIKAVEQIALSNPVDYIVSTERLYEAAGYDLSDITIEPKTISATPLYNSDVGEILEAFHKRPEMKALFSITKNATKADIEKAMKIIEALKDE